MHSNVLINVKPYITKLNLMCIQTVLKADKAPSLKIKSTSY